MSNTTTTIVDDFENSFESCLAYLTDPPSNHVHESEEIKTTVEQCVQKFLDLAKQMEAFFLQKRQLIAYQKPEQILLEDINELKSEILRKDQIIQRNYEKIQTWQSILSESSGSTTGNMVPPPAAGIPRPGQNVPVSNIHPAANNPQMTPAPQMRQAPQMPATHMNPPVSQIAHQSSPAQHQMIHHPPNQQGMMAPPPTNASPAVSVMPQMPQISNQMQGYMPSQNQSSLQGPLAFLERTTSNIGMPDPRRSN